MKLKRLALVAEVIGAAAILITLVFVVVELRDSTRAQDAATYQDMSRDVQAIFDRLPVELRVKTRTRGEPLDETERYTYGLYTLMALRIGESWWHQWQLGTIDEEVLSSYINHIHGALNDHVARDTWRAASYQFMPGYQDYIDNHISDNPLP